MLTLFFLLLSFAIRTDQSLILKQNTYGSILFRVDTNAVEQVEFSTAGDPPPGMVFENTPCHKPGQRDCTALASANGLYLDGVPQTAGSYHVTIKAKQADQQASQEFTIVVKAN